MVTIEKSLSNFKVQILCFICNMFFIQLICALEDFNLFVFDFSFLGFLFPTVLVNNMVSMILISKMNQKCHSSVQDMRNTAVKDKGKEKSKVFSRQSS